MTKEEIIEYLYSINCQSDIKIEEMAEDLAEKARPQGHWIKLYYKNVYACDDYGKSYVECSVCGETNGTNDSDFCPNCGADMRGNTND